VRRHLKPKLVRMDRYNGEGTRRKVHVVDQLHQLQLDNAEICFRHPRAFLITRRKMRRINRDLFMRFRFPFLFLRNVSFSARGLSGERPKINSERMKGK